ncbi:MAG: acyl transferase, partial [Bacteroidota bacterium]
QQVSRHHVRNVAAYLQNARRGFATFYGKVSDYCVLALLPSYLERQGSSLVAMADDFIRCSKYSQSGFFLHNTEQLVTTLEECQQRNIPTLLLGVSFALLDLAEQYHLNLAGMIVMETGGMKGRRKEVIRANLHQQLCEAFQTPYIHSEYGMTELLSQAYSKGNGIFEASPSMKILIREVGDPFSYQPHQRTGGINIIDLANINSCSFISTSDLGKSLNINEFEIIGRFDNSDIRGCNLMLSDFK